MNYNTGDIIICDNPSLAIPSKILFTLLFLIKTPQKHYQFFLRGSQ